jgi:hypothetical protein
MPLSAGLGKNNQPFKDAPQRWTLLRAGIKWLSSGDMKFALAISVFVLFAFFISWGIVLMMHGSPWLLLSAVGVFLGTFIKYGCLSH